MTARVTVILVGYKSQPWLERCLSTLQNASAHPLNLCFVDNLDNPTWPDLQPENMVVETLKTAHPMGFAEANNFAIRNSKVTSEFLLFLNQDTVSTSGWIDRCVECFDADPSLGALSPALRTYGLDEWEPNLIACLHESRLDETCLPSPVAILRNVTAAAMMVRAEVLSKVGPFDPIFGSYYEDYDLCRRIRNAGYRIGVCTQAAVGHFSGSVSTSPAARQRQQRAIIRNRLIHQCREAEYSRAPVLLRHFLIELPINLIRGVLKTPSSQPLTATVAAHCALIPLLPRLMSRTYDERRFLTFLSEFQEHGHGASPAHQ